MHTSEELYLLIKETNKQSYRGKSFKQSVINTMDFCNDKYKDFLYNVLKLKQIKFYESHNQHFQREQTNIVGKGFGNYPCVYFRSFDCESFYHELGHALDNFTTNPPFTTAYLFDDLRSFNKICEEEFSANAEAIFTAINKEIDNDIDYMHGEGMSSIYRKYIKIHTQYLDLYNLFLNNKEKTIKLNNKLYTNDQVKQILKEMNDDMQNSGYVDLLIDMIEKKTLNTIAIRYGTIIDALTSKYKFLEQTYAFSGHSEEYFKNIPIGVEVFAHCFMAELTNNSFKRIDMFKSLFPKTYDAFTIILNKIVDIFNNNNTYKGVEKAYQEVLNILEE